MTTEQELAREFLHGLAGALLMLTTLAWTCVTVRLGSSAGKAWDERKRRKRERRLKGEE